MRNSIFIGSGCVAGAANLHLALFGSGWARLVSLALFIAVVWSTAAAGRR